MSSKDLDLQTKNLLGNYANTYVFTKALAERILQ
jgi:hypothetical protein